tara:strand:+ start:13798 stop:14583 length:786 start_codon:yes stop_codon:yes gene_type:complete
MTRPPLLLSVFAALVLIFLQLPVIVVAISSFTETSYLMFPPQGFTFRWFGAVLTDPEWLSAIGFSLMLALQATLASLVFGTAAAYAISRRMIPGSDAIASFLMAPLVFPAVVIGVALLQFYALVGWRGNFVALVAAHVVLTSPYVVRACLSSLAGVKPDLEEAASTLGASGLTTFRLVTLPLLKPGMVAGGFFSFITSLDNVPVTIFLLGPGQSTLPVKIFTAIDQGGVDPGLAAISTILILVTGAALAIAERWVGFSRFV